MEPTQAKQFTVTYPLFALVDGETSEGAKMVGAPHPQTGHSLVFVFTDDEQATRFATNYGEGEAEKIADNIDQFREFLKRGAPEVVAFDPVCRPNRYLEVKFQVFVKTILGR